MAGKFWGNGNYMKVGGPDAVYDDDGAAAAYAMLHLFCQWRFLNDALRRSR